MINQEAVSPISGKPNLIEIDSITSKDITAQYLRDHGIDVASYFGEIDEIKIYRCLDTLYEFYYPFVTGDSKFYEAFQVFDWYYKKEKWEYDKALSLISKEESILEIGSGRGFFIKKLTDKGCNVEGIELNQDAVTTLKEQGFMIHNSAFEDFCKSNPTKQYDTICSFQLMEHITNVGEFFHYYEKQLKVGGKLIIGVPNCKSVFLVPRLNTLNLPPHHAGLWTEDFVKKLPTIFSSLKLKTIYYEPLSLFDRINVGVFLYKKYKLDNSSNGNLLTLFKKLIKGLFLPVERKARHILIVFEKI
jgi:2-polyprenyl-3-methyl-5-hydroxy-6-metoxy-1,4-benzoquinol methylase